MAAADRSRRRPPGRRYSFGQFQLPSWTGPAIVATDLGPIDAVLVSHDHHGDNFDSAGRPCSGGWRRPHHLTGAGRPGGNARAWPWATTQLEAPTAHHPDHRHPLPPRPPLSRPIAGAVVGFALGWEGQARTLWVTGDTVVDLHGAHDFDIPSPPGWKTPASRPGDR